MKIISMLMMLVFLYSFLPAQKNAPMRIEIEAKKGSDNYNIVPVGKSGLIFFYESDEKTKGNKIWVFTKLSTDFTDEWNKEIPVPARQDFIRYFIDDKKNKLYVLLGTNLLKIPEINIHKNDGDFTILTVDLTSGEIKKATGEIPGRLSITDFVVINNKAFLSGVRYPSFGQTCAQTCIYITCIPIFFGPVIIRYNAIFGYADVNNGQFTYIDPMYKKQSFVANSGIYEDKTEEIYQVVTRNHLNKRDVLLNINTISQDGKIIDKQLIESDNTHNLLDGNISKINDNESLIIGTYTQKPKSTFAFIPARFIGIISASIGMYIAKYKGNKQDYIRFYPFNKFDNFYNYLKEYYSGLYGDKKKKKADKKANKEKEKQAKYNVPYELIVHDIIQRSEQYIIISEAFFREYHTEFYTSYENGHMVTKTRRVFDGFRYTHATVAAFDKKGEKLWDNSFAIMDILTFSLKERIKVMMSGTDIILAYSNGGAITSKIIREDKVIEGSNSVKIETGYEKDNVKSNYKSDMAFWYDNYFITWGYQNIKNTEEKVNGKRKRNVFYFNKIGLE